MNANKSKVFIPCLSFKQTVTYNQELKKVIFKWFENNNYELVDIDLPLSSEVNAKVNSDCNSIRSIDFDSTVDYSIYEIINSFDNLIRYICYYYEPENNSALFFKYSIIDRDLINSKILKESLIYHFEVNFKENDRFYLENKKNKILKFVLKSLWNSICEFANKNKLTQINVSKDCDWVTSEKVNFLSPLNNYKNSLEKYLKVKKISAIFYQEKNFLENFNNCFLQSYDANNTVCLYVWFNQFKTYDEIITLTIRPNWEIYKKQNNISENNSNSFNKEYMNDFLDLTKKGIKGTSLAIKIHIEKLLIYLLAINNEKEIPSKLNDFCLNSIFKIKNIK